MNAYKRVLVQADVGGEASRTLLSYALGLATAQGAALTVLGPTVPDDLLASAKRAGTSVDLRRLGADDDAIDLLLTASRTADVLVVAQPGDPGRMGLPRAVVSKLLVAAACPVLFMPPGTGAERVGSRVLVAWSGTRESARALRDALPILQRAQSVHVCQFASAERGAAQPLAEVGRYLQSHGVQAVCSFEPILETSFSQRMLTPTVVDAPIAELLLSHAADMDGDLIVMGGYGHARMHELVLGGVTRTVLTSMTMPVLMSH